jgi:hypothetical protein
MSRGILTVLVVALVAGAAFATPTVTYTLTPIADGTAATGTGVTGTIVGHTTVAADVAAGLTGVYEIQVAYQIASGGQIGDDPAPLAFANLATGITFTNSALAFGYTIKGKTNLGTSYYANPAYVASVTGYLEANGYNGVQAAGTLGQSIYFASDIDNNGPGTGLAGDQGAIIVGDIFVKYTNAAGSTTLDAGAGLSSTGGVNTAALNAFTNETPGTPYDTGTPIVSWASSGAGSATYVDGGGVVFNTATPEPATMSLLIIGGIGALLRRRTA